MTSSLAEAWLLVKINVPLLWWQVFESRRKVKKLNEPIPASFCFLTFNSHSNSKYCINWNYINWKSVDFAVGTQTRASRMVGTDGATELWRLPRSKKLLWFSQKETNKIRTNSNVQLCLIKSSFYFTDESDYTVTRAEPVSLCWCLSTIIKTGFFIVEPLKSTQPLQPISGILF